MTGALPPSIGQVLELVAADYCVSPQALLSRRRDRTPVLARHVAMWVAREATRSSLPEIGRRLDRDHSSVLNGLRNVLSRRKLDPEFRARTDRLLRAAEAAGARGGDPDLMDAALATFDALVAVWRERIRRDPVSFLNAAAKGGGG